MKKPSFLLIFLLSSITALAQSVKYETFIYSSDDLADEIQSLCEERNSTRSRSEERRVGKECRSRWSPYQLCGRFIQCQQRIG